MHSLSIDYAFNPEYRKADVSWLPATLAVYGAVVVCALALVAALDVTGAGNAAELMGSAIALAAP